MRSAVLGISFLALAAWTLRPDSMDALSTTVSRLGIFGISLTSFFLAEIGDKTQVATVALTASFDDAVAVVAGTTWGMMVANAPAVLLGSLAFERVPMRAVRVLAASLFALMGVVILIGADIDFPPHNASSGP